MLFQRRTLGGRLEILEADLALDALREDVLYTCVSALNMEHRYLFFFEEDRGQARRFRESKKKNVPI
jgi:hypothetical protein